MKIARDKFKTSKLKRLFSLYVGKAINSFLQDIVVITCF